MNAVYADTSYWIALLNREDGLHSKAMRLNLQMEAIEIVTSEMVLVEVLNHFAGASPRLRAGVSVFIEEMYDHPYCRVITQSSRQFREALNFYRQRADKQWSLTDCASMLIMRSEGIQAALSYDRHFAQAGFTALLRENVGD